MVPEHDRLYVLARNNADPFNYLSQDERSKEYSKILEYDLSLNLLDEFYPPHAITDFHQGIYHAGKLWLTCTILNAIYIYDFSYWEVWYPLQSEGKMDSDINHFNSITIKNNKVYVLAHNFGESEVYCFDIDTKEFLHLITLGTYAHNVWFDDEENMWVCDSSNHSIINTKEGKVVLAGFTRGVTIGQSAIYVGSSGLSERNNRKDVDSEIFVLEPDYQLRGQIPVNGYGQILDIQLLIR